MEIFIAAQLVQAGVALLIGVLAGIYYDVLKAIRRQFKGTGATICLDICFWLGMLLALIGQIMTVGQGAARIFMVALNFGGGVLYFLVLSVQVSIWIEKCFIFLIRVTRMITGPIQFCWGKLKKISKKLKKGFQKMAKCYTIKRNNRLSMRKRVK